MQVKVSGRHGHLGDDHQAAIREKAEKLLTYFERVTLIEVTVDMRGPTKKAEVRLDAEHKHDFVAHGEADDILPAVAAAIDRMKVQLTHYKERVQDHRRDPSHGGTADGRAI